MYYTHANTDTSSKEAKPKLLLTSSVTTSMPLTVTLSGCCNSFRLTLCTGISNSRWLFMPWNWYNGILCSASDIHEHEMVNSTSVYLAQKCYLESWLNTMNRSPPLPPTPIPLLNIMGHSNLLQTVNLHAFDTIHLPQKKKKSITITFFFSLSYPKVDEINMEPAVATVKVFQLFVNKGKPAIESFLKSDQNNSS